MQTQSLLSYILADHTPMESVFMQLSDVILSTRVIYATNKCILKVEAAGLEVDMMNMTTIM